MSFEVIEVMQEPKTPHLTWVNIALGLLFLLLDALLSVTSEKGECTLPQVTARHRLLPQGFLLNP